MIFNKIAITFEHIMTHATYTRGKKCPNVESHRSRRKDSGKSRIVTSQRNAECRSRLVVVNYDTFSNERGAGDNEIMSCSIDAPPPPRLSAGNCAVEFRPEIYRVFRCLRKPTEMIFPETMSFLKIS